MPSDPAADPTRPTAAEASVAVEPGAPAAACAEAEAITSAAMAAPTAAESAAWSTTAAPRVERAARYGPIVRGMAWMALGGLLLVVMNALMKRMTAELSPLQAQFLRYLFGLAVMLPLVVRDGLAVYRPRSLRGQLWRGLVHTAGLTLFFIALPHVPLADMTAILFTSPIFVLAGAALLLRERVTAARWAAAAVGFAGVAVVVWPQLRAGEAGFWSLVMLASTPLFAASFLITKALTREDSPRVIVAWQNLTVTLFALPLALPFWQAPNAAQWLTFAACGLLGSLAHGAMTRAFSLGDISAMQPMRFLDLVWSSLLGLALFGDSPAATTLAGGAIIVASTIWIARREALERAARMPGPA
jgi:drug/metabolite transporter (DMT)-like permease